MTKTGKTETENGGTPNMKKTIAWLLASLMILALVTGCSKKAEPKQESESQAEASEAGEEEAVLIRVNTEGLGCVAYAEDGEEPVFDEEYPVQSIATTVAKGTKLTLTCKADEGWAFSKWTRNGEFVSSDATITITADEDAEYIAAFGMGSGYEGEAVSDVSEAKTLADVLPLPSLASFYSEQYYVYAFELNGNSYRAVVELSKEESEALWSLEFDDPEYDQKLNDIIAPLEITRIDDLTAMVPAQEELDKLIGKTGADLLADGWSCSGYNVEDHILYMDHEMFTYEVGYEGEVDTSIEDYNELLKDLKVTSVTYAGLGDISADFQ